MRHASALIIYMASIVPAFGLAHPLEEKPQEKVAYIPNMQPRDVTYSGPARMDLRHTKQIVSLLVHDRRLTYRTAVGRMNTEAVKKNGHAVCVNFKDITVRILEWRDSAVIRGIRIEYWNILLNEESFVVPLQPHQ